MKSGFLFLLSLLPLAGYGQSQKIRLQQQLDSIRMTYLREAAVRYPALRQGSVSTEIIGNTSLVSEREGDKLMEGKVRVKRTVANFILPVYQHGKHSVFASAGFLHQQVTTRNTIPFDPVLVARDSELTKTNLNLVAGYSLSDSIFNRPWTVSASVSLLADGSFKRSRLNFIGVLSTPLKRTAATSLSVGVVLLLDPSSVIPVTPLVSYWHKFGKTGPELFADIPQRIMVRTQLSPALSASLGSQLSGSLLFFDFKNRELPEKSIAATVEVRSGLTLEYRVGRNIMLGLSGGLFSTPSATIFENNSRRTDYFIKNKINGASYINLSFSLLPFLKSAL